MCCINKRKVTNQITNQSRTIACESKLKELFCFRPSVMRSPMRRKIIIEMTKIKISLFCVFFNYWQIVVACTAPYESVIGQNKEEPEKKAKLFNVWFLITRVPPVYRCPIVVVGGHKLSEVRSGLSLTREHGSHSRGSPQNPNNVGNYSKLLPVGFCPHLYANLLGIKKNRSCETAVDTYIGVIA